MRIVLCCATRRGYLFLKRLRQLSPQSQLVVFSFREEPWEPPFFDETKELTKACDGQFFEAKQVGGEAGNPFWESTPVDLMLLVNWRYMIPASVYRRARRGTFVFHDSLLPEYRGFSPTVWAVLNGEDHTGVTLFEIAEAVDAGDIVDQQRIPIGQDDTIAALVERVTQSYLDLLERNLSKLLDGSAPRRPQDHACATYTCKRFPEDNRIHWASSSGKIYDLIRAVGVPYPGAFTHLSGQKLSVWSARRLDNARRYVGGIPGRVVEVRPGQGTVILTGDGSLLLTEVQLEGEKAACAADVLKRIGQTLGP